MEQLQRRERAGDVMGGQLSTEIVDKLVAASAIVAGGLNAGNVFQIVGTPGLLRGLQSGSLALMRTQGGLLGTVVSSSTDRIAGQARFLPASLAPVLAPVLIWQVLHGIVGASQLRRINLRLDTMTRQLERLQTRHDARLLGEVHAAKEALDSILAERVTTGRFTVNMAINLTLVENKVNAIFAGNVVLMELLRHHTDELQRTRGKDGALRTATFLNEEGAQAQFDLDLLAYLAALNVRVAEARIYESMEHNPADVQRRLDAASAKISTYKSLLQDLPSLAAVSDHAQRCLNEMTWWEEHMNARAVARAAKQAAEYAKERINVSVAATPANPRATSSGGRVTAASRSECCLRQTTTNTSSGRQSP